MSSVDSSLTQLPHEKNYINHTKRNKFVYLLLCVCVYGGLCMTVSVNVFKRYSVLLKEKPGMWNEWRVWFWGYVSYRCAIVATDSLHYKSILHLWFEGTRIEVFLTMLFKIKEVGQSKQSGQWPLLVPGSEGSSSIRCERQASFEPYTFLLPVGLWLSIHNDETVRHWPGRGFTEPFVFARPD